MKKKDFFELVKEIKALASSEEGRKKLTKDPKKAIEDEGYKYQEGLELVFLQNTKDTHYFVVPIEDIPEEVRIEDLPKKPKYHDIGLWMIHQIQTNTLLKDRLLKDPLSVMDEYKIPHAKDLKIKILCNTFEKLHIVLPSHNQDQLTDKELKALSGGGNSFFSGNFSHGLLIPVGNIWAPKSHPNLEWWKRGFRI